MAFTCNQGGGTGGFSWRTVNQNNTTTGPVVTLTQGGMLNAAGLMVVGRNVVEKGSNSNGDYVRFADGTQICWRGNVPFGPAGAGVAATIPVTPAAAFLLSQPVVIVPLVQYAEVNDAFNVNRITANIVSNGNINVSLNASISQVYRLAIIAIGRWFI